MKKYIIIPLIIFLLVSNTMNVNAAHQHSENCYVVQEHVHTGNETSGGGCYGTVNYHVHSGDSASGGGCYGAANGHVHSGNATSGGGCYGAANYHVHSGDATNGGGCYGTPVYHVHEGQAGQAAANGCYVSLGTASVVCGTYKERDIVYRCGICTFCCGTGSYGYFKDAGHSTSTGEVCSGTLIFGGYAQCSGCNAYGAWALRGTTHYVAKETYVLGCGKTEETVEYYEVSCGKNIDVVESYSLNCGKTEVTVEGYSLNCGKTTETVESYSLNCEYQENPVIRTQICTLGGNAYADTKETGIGKKYRRVCFEERIFMAGRCKQTRYQQFLCFKGM